MMKRTRRWHWLVFCWYLGFLYIFSFVSVNAYVQLGLLIVKCLLDYTYLSRQTYRPFASALNYFFLSSACLILHFCFICSSTTSESLWYFKLVTYLRPHFCANDVYKAVGCIRIQLICLLFVVFSLLTTKLSIWFQTRGRHWKQINSLCPSFTSLRPIMFKLHMLPLMPMMITTTCSLSFYLWKLRKLN